MINEGMVLILFCLCVQFMEAGETGVFKASIENGDEIGKEWKLTAAKDCVPNIEKSPKGNRVFIARIPTGKQSLKLTKLSKHTHIRVRFDLIIQGSWDGIHKTWGPDIWRFDIDGGEPIVNSTFCNFSAGLRQSFPDFHGERLTANKNYTCAAESETLGYLWNNGQRDLAADSVYSFDFLVPHVKSSVSLNFESIFNDVGGPEANKDQWYGLDNVSVAIVDSPQQLSLEGIAKKVEALNSKQASSRYDARTALLRSDISFIQWLETSYVKSKKIDIQSLIKQLNSPDHDTRLKAMMFLVKHGFPYEKSLKKSFAETTEPEVKARLQYVFNQWRGSNNQSNSVYAVEMEIKRLLKIINTPKAKALLAKIGQSKTN